LGEETTTTTIASKRMPAAENEAEDDEEDKMDSWTEEELYAKILPLVSPSETVTQALVRYGNLLKRKPGRKKSVDDDDEAQQLARTALNDLTEASNALLLKGKIDIYQKTRSDLEQLLPGDGEEEAATDGKPRSKGDGSSTAAVRWEYRGSQDGQIHGPYATRDMLGWIRAGYFVGPSAVSVRTVAAAPVAAKERNKSLQEDLLDDLMGDDDDDSEKKPEEPVRGEWMRSDQVDFTKYA
jgi:CD2 antigen cytoplasmic tail-binding protein 2